MTSFLENLDSRHAAKGFLANKVVAADKIAKINASIEKTPTSFGLQPFFVRVVSDKNVKAKMQESGWNQPQFAEASHVYVFVARTNVLDRVEEMLTLRSAGNAEVRASLKGYEAMMRGAFEGKPEAEVKTWAQKQVYIALGFALAACAELGVESCPMEGFLPEKFNEILGLGKGEYSTVALCVGEKNSALNTFPKFRFPKADLVRA